MRNQSNWRQWAFAAAFTALLTFIFGTGVAHAHALLVRSTPAANAELSLAPATIDFWFSEPLEAHFSTAYLIDAAGNQFGVGAAAVDAADPTHLTLPLPTLSPNIYTVVYRTLSQADGHEWVGSFPLTVLHSDGTRPAGGAGSTGPARGETPGVMLILSRWLALVGAMLLLGVLAFERLVLPSAPPTASVRSGWWAVAERTLWRGLLIGGGALLLGSWLQWAAQARALDERQTLVALILQTRGGNLLLYRQLLTIALLLVGYGALRTPRPAAALRWLALLLGLAMVATFSLGSHAAAAVGRNWAMLGDFVHLAGASVWLGGLLVLAAILWELRTEDRAEAGVAPSWRPLVRRFSALATVAMAVILSTGLFTSLVHLHSWAALWQSAYGRLLVAKVLLVTVALGLALLNHRLVRNTSGRANAWSPRQAGALPRQVWQEAGVSLVLMVAVAILVQTPPPVAAPTLPVAESFSAVLDADDLSIHLQITPNQVGNNRYSAHLFHPDGSAIGEVQLVRLQFEHQTAELGRANLDLTPQGQGAYSAEGAYFNQAGPWDLTVYIRRRGLDDALATTTVTVASPASPSMPTSSPWQNPVAEAPTALVIGGALAGLLAIGWLWRGQFGTLNKPIRR